jgi:hypothetical protein
MRNILVFLMFFSAVIYTTNCFAGVRFITDSPHHTRPDKLSSGTGSGGSSSGQVSCENAGYKKTSCSNGMVLTNRCPYDNKYYKDCCAKEFNRTKEYCYARDMVPSKKSCGDLHYCEY